MSSVSGRAAAVTLSLLGSFVSLGLVACGNDLQVVEPVEAGPPTSVAPGGPGSGSSSTGLVTTDTSSTTVTVATTTSTTVATTTTTSAPQAPPTTLDPTQYQGPEAESLAFVNQMRAENGEAPLVVDPALTAMAEGWAAQISADQDLRHNPDLGDQAPDDYMSIGENVGYAPSAAAIDQGWWESDGHRENILRSSFDAIGIAFVADENGTTWGVQVFAGS